MVKRAMRERARELRKQGWSVKAITRELQVSRGSISAWVRDIELTGEQIENLNARRSHWAGQNKGAQLNRDRAREKRVLRPKTWTVKSAF